MNRIKLTYEAIMLSHQSTLMRINIAVTIVNIKTDSDAKCTNPSSVLPQPSDHTSTDAGLCHLDF